MIQPISGLVPNAAQSPAEAAGVKKPPEIQSPERQNLNRSPKPAMDEYIPEEKQEPSGRYWIGRDGDGQPKVYFDDPERAADASKDRDGLPDVDGRNQEPDVPGKKTGDDRKAEACRGSTDAVDQEIEKLKKKREKLERQINSETDETKIKELEKQLAQVERELRQKDNDAYRRQHTVFS